MKGRRRHRQNRPCSGHPNNRRGRVIGRAAAPPHAVRQPSNRYGEAIGTAGQASRLTPAPPAPRQPARTGRGRPHPAQRPGDQAGRSLKSLVPGNQVPGNRRGRAGEPTYGAHDGGTVRWELGPGTGHGARLVFSHAARPAPAQASGCARPGEAPRVRDNRAPGVAGRSSASHRPATTPPRSAQQRAQRPAGLGAAGQPNRLTSIWPPSHLAPSDDHAASLRSATGRTISRPHRRSHSSRVRLSPGDTGRHAITSPTG